MYQRKQEKGLIIGALVFFSINLMLYIYLYIKGMINNGFYINRNVIIGILNRLIYVFLPLGLLYYKNIKQLLSFFMVFSAVGLIFGLINLFEQGIHGNTLMDKALNIFWIIIKSEIFILLFTLVFIKYLSSNVSLIERLLPLIIASIFAVSFIITLINYKINAYLILDQITSLAYLSLGVFLFIKTSRVI